MCSTFSWHAYCQAVEARKRKKERKKRQKWKSKKKNLTDFHYKNIYLDIRFSAMKKIFRASFHLLSRAERQALHTYGQWRRRVFRLNRYSVIAWRSTIRDPRSIPLTDPRPIDNSKTWNGGEMIDESLNSSPSLTRYQVASTYGPGHATVWCWK